MARGFGGLPVTGVSLNVNRNAIAEEAFGIATQPTIYGGTYSVSGSVDAVYRSDLKAPVLNSFFSGFTTGIVTPTASIVMADDVAQYTVYNYAFNSLELKGSVKDFLRVTGGFIAQKAKQTGSAPSSPSYANSPAPFYNTTVEIDGDVKCSAFSLKFDKPIDADNFVLGSPLLQTTTGDASGKYIQNGASAISGSVTMANSEYALFANLMATRATGDDTEAPDKLNEDFLGGGTLTITFGELSSDNTIVLPCKFSEGSISAQGRNRFDKTISFMCPISSSSDITCLGATIS